MLEKIINTSNDKLFIHRQRKYIGTRIKEDSANIRSDQITTIAAADLRLLFNLYDHCFFGDWFDKHFPGKIVFSLSRRMTKSAGITICPKNIGQLPPPDIVIEIRLGVDFFFHFDQAGGPITVAGITARNSLEALQLVFEHELCHVIEFVLYHRSNCKGERFKSIARNCFAHSASTHQLPTYEQLAQSNREIKVGDRVAFSYQNELLSGLVIRITKNATVMVPDSKGRYRDPLGRRYTKYYVPLEKLHKTKEH